MSEGFRLLSKCCLLGLNFDLFALLGPSEAKDEVPPVSIGAEGSSLRAVGPGVEIGI